MRRMTETRAADGYDPQAIEAEWQSYWREHGTYEVDNDDPRPHYYSLCMYPYPSGRRTWGTCATTRSAT